VAMRDLERSRLRCAYGRHQLDNAPGSGEDRLLLELRPDVKLLDVGAGSGMAGTLSRAALGCDVVLVTSCRGPSNCGSDAPR